MGLLGNEMERLTCVEELPVTMLTSTTNKKALISIKINPKYSQYHFLWLF